MQDLMLAFHRQVSWWVHMTVGVFNVIETVHQKQSPFPFNSALVDDCLQNGRDYMSGGAHYNFNGMQGVGIANVADSLASIRDLVFADAGNAETRMELPALIEVLRRDFSGADALRRRMTEKVPRYGNDDDRADLLAREVGRIYCGEVERYTSPRGAHYQPGLYPVSANVPLGHDVAASADGRHARTPLADGVAPSHGADRKGPTAVLLSAAKLDQFQASNGTQLNQKFLPSVLATEAGRIRFAGYLRTFVNLPVMEVQFNVVDGPTLRDAQKYPERHESLVVRVAGYSAFFSDLDKSTQDDIIGRTEQAL
jgi:formate C-acetyltransferase